jgi:hypothetical protein
MRGDRRRKTKKGGGGLGRINNIKEATQTLPGFSAEVSLHTTTSQSYHLTRKYVRSSGATSFNLSPPVIYHIRYPIRA